MVTTVSLGEWWERWREAWILDSAPSDTFKITLWNSKYHHVCWFQLPQGAKRTRRSLRQTSHMQFRVLLSRVISDVLGLHGLPLSSDMAPKSIPKAESQPWWHRLPLTPLYEDEVRLPYMGMGDNFSKSKGTVTAPPKCIRQQTQGYATLLRAMTQTSSLLNRTKTFPTGSYKWLVLTQSLCTPSFHSLWCRNVWPLARRPGQQKQPRSAHTLSLCLPPSLSLSLSLASALRISRNKQMGAGNVQPRVSCRLAERKESLHSPDILILLHPARGEQRFS